MIDITIRTRAGIAARISGWVSRRQRQLSARVHAAADERARQHGWTVTECTGRLGFAARNYRDPRFKNRRQQLALSEQDAAMPSLRRRSGPTGNTGRLVTTHESCVKRQRSGGSS
jgi:hypothetical protein